MVAGTAEELDREGWVRDLKYMWGGDQFFEKRLMVYKGMTGRAWHQMMRRWRIQPGDAAQVMRAINVAVIEAMDKMYRIYRATVNRSSKAQEKFWEAFLGARSIIF